MSGAGKCASDGSKLFNLSELLLNFFTFCDVAQDNQSPAYLALFIEQYGIVDIVINISESNFRRVRQGIDIKTEILRKRQANDFEGRRADNFLASKIDLDNAILGIQNKNTIAQIINHGVVGDRNNIQ